MAAFTGNSIVGQVVCGDGHVVSNGQYGTVSGPVSAQSFGSLAFRVTLGSGGVLTAQAFGAVTIKATRTVALGSVPSAQAFGVVVTVATGGPQSRAVNGVPSAQSFGAAVIVRGPVSRAVGGVGSAQSFGVLTIKTAIAPSAGGVPSAQAFGVPFVPPPIMPQTKAVGSVSSAQVFGAISFRTTVTRAIVGLGTAQGFGVVRAIFPPQTVQVQGIPRPIPIESITGRVICGDGHVVGGTNVLFGRVHIAYWQPQPVLGVQSAQRFGTPTGRGGPVTIAIGVGCPSAAAFGFADAWLVWVRSLPCTDLDLAASACTDLALVDAVPADLDLAELACLDLDLEESPVTDLDLQPLVCT